MRRLWITVSGRWFLALTILIGVSALATANNVLYLIESLLLSGLILSGILSERTIASVQVSFRRFPISAGQTSRDQIIIRNPTKRPLYCIEISEWAGKNRFTPISFVPFLAPGEFKTLASQQILPERGHHHWKGYGIATRFPFGFAQKTRILSEPDQRIVWPEVLQSEDSHTQPLTQDTQLVKRSGTLYDESEIRPMTHDDDARMIVWTLSARGGDPVVRNQKQPTESPEISLDLSKIPPDEFEDSIKKAARWFYQLEERSSDGVLKIIQSDSTSARLVYGRQAALNELAVMQRQAA